MAKKTRSSNLGCLVALAVVALLATLAYIFWDDLANPIRGGSGPNKEYPTIVKRGVQSNSVRHKPR